MPAKVSYWEFSYSPKNCDVLLFWVSILSILIFAIGSLLITNLYRTNERALELLAPTWYGTASLISPIVSMTLILRNSFEIWNLRKIMPGMALTLLTVSLIGVSSITLMYFKTLPVIINCFGQVVYTIRIIEWNSTLFAVVTILETLDYNPRTSPKVIVMEIICCSFGSMALLCQENILLSIICNLIAYSTFLHLPLSLFERIKKYSDMKSRNVQVEESAETVIFLWSALLLLWTPFAVVNLLSCLGLVDTLIENFIYSSMSVLIKGLYAPALFSVHSSVILENKKVKEIQTETRHFLRYVFHEIRVPLNSIIVGLDLFYSKPRSLNKEEEEIFDCLGNSSRMISRLLDDVLAIERIECGRLELQKSPMDFRKCVDEVVFALRETSLSKSVIVNVVVDPEIPELVLGDELRLTQVMNNLLSNAIHFTKPKSLIHVELREIKNADECSQIEFSVKDHGDGVSAEDMSKLFRPFASLRKGESQYESGSGLGLSICKEIIAACKGEIGVIPHEEGSTFFFRVILPIVAVGARRNSFKHARQLRRRLSLKSKERIATLEVEDQVADFRSKKSPSPWSPTTPSSPKSKISGDDMISAYSLDRTSSGISSVSDSEFTQDDARTTPPTSKRMLVVDDVRSNRLLMQRFFENQGFEVSEACNGKEAVDRQEAESFDVILMDNMMPVMTGTQATTLIRSRGSKVPIIGITGNVLEEDLSQFEHSGADIVLSKPVNLSLLKNHVYKLLLI